MKIRRYYVGGMISLILLPLGFLVYICVQRQNAIYYGTIDVECFPNCEIQIDRRIPHIPVFRYAFEAGNDAQKLSSFRHHCDSIRGRDSCSWFVVQLVDIMQQNSFFVSIKGRSLEYRYDPNHVRPTMKQVRTSFKDEYIYVRDQLRELLCNQLEASKATISKTGFDSPYFAEDREEPYPFWFSTHLMMRYTIKDDPWSKVLVDRTGSWLFAVLVLWIVLFAISLKRQLRQSVA